MHENLVTKYRKVTGFILLIMCMIQAYAQTHFTEPVINQYSKVLTVLNYDPLTVDSLEIQDPESFQPGDLVLFIVMKGAEIYTSYNLPTIPNFWGKIMNMNNTGYYSLHTITEIYGNHVVLSGKLTDWRQGKKGQVAQLVKVPSVESAVIDNVLSCKPWDPISGTGGVLALLATYKIKLNAQLDVTGKGFLGADPSVDYYHGGCTEAIDSFYTDMAVDSAGLKGEGIVFEGFKYKRGFLYAANAGGGGNGKYSGGGGGGNYGTGGFGGKEFADCSPDISLGGNGRNIPPGFFTNEGPFRNRLFMGGGGGASTQNPDSSRIASPGGNGGGIIILITDTLEVNQSDTIKANGGSVLSTATAGGGGGGAAGIIVVDVKHYLGNIHMEVKGGNGGDTHAPVRTGPGAFGGAGMVWFSGDELPSNVSVDTIHGISGIHVPTNSFHGSITSSDLYGTILGNLILPVSGTLFNSLADKYVKCTEEFTIPIPATTPKGGDGSYSYSWEQSADLISWITADGEANAEDYIPQTNEDTVYLRRIVSSGLFTDTSNAIQVIQIPILQNNTIVGIEPVCEEVVPGRLTQGTEPVSGGTGIYRYTWQIKDTTGYKTAPGISNTLEYDPPLLSENTYFRRIVHSDECSSESNEVEIVIKKLPIINKQPVGDTIDSGETIVFSIEATGDEPLHYKWRHNNIEIPDVSGASLTINEATPNSSGYYDCVVTNDCGTVSSDPAYLLVIPGVNIEEHNKQIEMILFPNPAKNTIEINHPYSGSHTIRLYNSAGTLVESMNNHTVLEINDLPEGIYSLLIYYHNSGNVSTSRFIKVK